MNVTKGYIYSITSANGLHIYIGSSCKDPRYRLACHRHCATSGKMPNLAHLFEDGEPVLRILEQVDNVPRVYLRQREQFYLDQNANRALNKNRADFNKLEYDQKMRENIKCDVCGKEVQRIYFGRHQRGERCKTHTLRGILAEFGRLPCEKYVPRVPKPPTPATEVPANQ